MMKQKFDTLSATNIKIILLFPHKINVESNKNKHKFSLTHQLRRSKSPQNPTNSSRSDPKEETLPPVVNLPKQQRRRQQQRRITR